jgi:hypothetical protein
MARCKLTAPWPERTESRYWCFEPGMLQAPGAGTTLVWVSLPLSKYGHGHERLEGRAGWVQALYGAVNHWGFPIFIQGFPVFTVDAVDKQIGVKRGFGHQGQYAACLWVYRHHGATAVAQQLIGFLLHADVHGQAQGLAALGRGVVQNADDVAHGVFFHFLHAWNAMQLWLIIGF